jgi:hypothetical protein
LPPFLKVADYGHAALENSGPSTTRLLVLRDDLLKVYLPGATDPSD